MSQNFNTGYHPSLFKPKPHVFISVFHADNSYKIYNQNIRALLNKKKILGYSKNLELWNNCQDGYQVVLSMFHQTCNIKATKIWFAGEGKQFKCNAPTWLKYLMLFE